MPFILCTRSFVNSPRGNFYDPLFCTYRSKIQVDGEYTLSENVCDVDGLRVAVDAFLEMSAAAGGTFSRDLVYLPNNPYTPQQLFFINAAQVHFSCA